MRVLFTGEPRNAVNPSHQTAEALASIGVEVEFDPGDGWRSRGWRKACDRADVVHVITYSQCDWRLLRRLWRARMQGAQIVRCWVGSDVMWARYHAPSRRFAQALGHLRTTNLAVADHLVEELESIGVAARSMPVITPNVIADREPHPLPYEFTVLCYLPSRRREFYGGSVIDRLIEALPDVRFIVLGDSETDYGDRQNVESLGFVDNLDRTMGRSTVLVRPTHHDGMPRMLLEMLSHGRHVIASHPYPHCHHTAGFDETLAWLRRLQHRCDFNLPGRAWVCEHFETNRTATELRDLLQQLGARRSGKWQAMQLLSRCPWMLGRTVYELPKANELPDEAEALRVVLRGYEHAAQPSAETVEGGA